MAERKQSGKAAEDEEVPAFFKNLGSGSPKPRQKFCGMFCPVEGSSENKTIDFDSLSVGRGSGQVVAQQRDVAHLGPDPQPPYSRQGRRAGGEPSVESGRKVEIRRASGKEALQNIYDQVGIGGRGGLRGGSGARIAPCLPPFQLGRAPRIPACPPSCPSPRLLRAGYGEAGARPWRPRAHKGCPRFPGLEGGGGGKGGADPRWGSHGGGWGWAAVPFFLNPPGQLRIAAVAGCPTLFQTQL